MACFATPYGLRYAAHCFNRAHAQQSGSALIPAGGKLGVTSLAESWGPRQGDWMSVNVLARYLEKAEHNVSA